MMINTSNDSIVTITSCPRATAHQLHGDDRRSKNYPSLDILSANSRSIDSIMAEENNEVDQPPMDEVSVSKDETASSSNSAPRFEIKKWNAVTMWSWDICADTCAICRNSLNEPSIEYQANPSPNNENGLSIAFGTCGHVFHLDCIQRWLKTRSVCPLCNKEWDFAKIEKIPGYGTMGA